MIFATETPPAISLSKNQIWQGFTTDYKYHRGASVYVLFTQTAAPLNVGDTVELTWTQYPGAFQKTLIFTAVINPTADEEILAVPSGTFSPDYLNIVMKKIGGHPLVAPFFTHKVEPTFGGIKIELVAESYDEDWNVDFDFSGATATGWSGGVVTKVAQTASTYPENYSIVVEVMFEPTYRGTDFQRIATLELSPDLSTINEISRVDLHRILDKEIQNSMMYYVPPSPSLPGPTIAPNLRRYYVRWAERSGSPITESDFTDGAVKFVMSGGVDWRKSGQADFFSALNADNSILSWYPDGKKVSIDQPEFLPWYNFGNTRNVAIELESFDEIGQSLGAAEVYGTNPISVRKYETALIPVGMIPLNIGASVYKYAVRVKDADTNEYLSQIRTYFVDFLFYRQRKYLAYMNSFGCPHSLRCTGEFAKSISVDRNIAKKYLEKGYSHAAGEYEQFGYEFDTEYTYRTGYLHKAEVNALGEMFLYNQIWEWKQDGWLRVILDAKKFKMWDTESLLFFAEFQTKRSLSAAVYSTEMLGDISTESDDLTEISDQYWTDPNGDFWQTPDGDFWVPLT